MPYYLRFICEADILNVPRANLLKRSRKLRLLMEMVDRYVQFITLCNFGSVYEDFLNTYKDHKLRSVRLFDTVIIDEASQVPYGAFLILFGHINRCLLDQNLDA